MYDIGEVYKNKKNGKYFICIEHENNGEIILINKEGKIISVEEKLFEKISEEEENKLKEENKKIFNAKQFKTFKEYIEFDDTESLNDKNITTDYDIMYDTRKNSLLKLFYDIGGKGTRTEINEHVPKYWILKDEELEIEKGTKKPLYWHRVASCCQALKDQDGFLENPQWGVWCITEAGIQHLQTLGYAHSDTIQTHPIEKTNGFDINNIKKNEIPEETKLKTLNDTNANQDRIVEIISFLFKHFYFSKKKAYDEDEFYFYLLHCNYTKNEIRTALDCLLQPPLNILEKENKTYLLTDEIDSVFKKMIIVLKAYRIFKNSKA